MKFVLEDVQDYTDKFKAQATVETPFVGCDSKKLDEAIGKYSGSPASHNAPALGVIAATMMVVAGWVAN